MSRNDKEKSPFSGDCHSMRYQDLLRSSRQGVMILDDTFNIKDVDIIAQELLGFRGIWSSDTLHAITSQLQKKFSTYEKDMVTQPVSLETEMQLEVENTEKIFRFFLNEKVEEGARTWFVLLQDVTLQRHRERMLLEYQQIPMVVLSNISDAVFITRENGQFTFICPNADVIFGYNPGEIASFENIEALLGRSVVTFGELKEKGEIVNIEHTIRDKNGTKHNLLINVKLVEIKNGTMLYTCRDITERKKSEVALEKAHRELEKKVEERTSELRSLYEQAPFGIYILDKTGRVLNTNDVIEEMFTQHADMYTIFDDAILAESDGAENIKSIFENGGFFTTNPLYYPPDYFGNGAEEGKYIIHRIYSITGKYGEVFRVVDLLEDYTLAKKAQDMKLELLLKKQRSALVYEATEKERNRLSKELHDSIGQICTAAIINIDLFNKKHKMNDTHIDEAKRLIEKASIEVDSIIQALHPAELDSHGLVHATEVLCKEIANMKSIDVNFGAYGMDERLSQKFESNLFRIIQEGLNNIAKHSDASEASVQLYQRGRSVVVTIEDNGKGFDSEQLIKRDRLAGFGISSMIERTDLLGGNIHFESHPGSGTDIHIEIPV